MINHFIKISRRIAALYSLRLLIALLLMAALFFWLFNFSRAPFSNPSLISLSGHDGLLDLLPFYSAAQAYTMLDHYGPAGRELYLQFLAADFIFIPIYTLGFALLFSVAIRAHFSMRRRWLVLNLLPFAIGAFDSVENLCILTMLQLFPSPTPLVGTLAGLATLCKSLLTLLSLCMLAYLGSTVMIRRLKSGRKPSAITKRSKR